MANPCHRNLVSSFLVALALLGGLFLCPEVYGQLECKPTVFPVQTFKRAVHDVQADTKELSDLFRGPSRRPLNNFLSNSESVATLMWYLRNPVPPLYSNKPVTTFLREVRENSTIFNWEGDNGTGAVLGHVVSDLSEQRRRVLSRRDAKVAAINRVITESNDAAGFFRSAIGLLVKVKNETEGVRDTYFKRAFDHLNSCMASCGGPRGFDLSAFKVRFDKLYGDSSGKNFEANVKELMAGRDSAEGLAKDLAELLSVGNKYDEAEAAKLQEAADILSDAQRNGAWHNVGATNDKIQNAINRLDTGYLADGKRLPTANEIGNRVDSTYSQAARVQSLIDSFLIDHTKLVDDLETFIADYANTYKPGCRAEGRPSSDLDEETIRALNRRLGTIKLTTTTTKTRAKEDKQWQTIRAM